MYSGTDTAHRGSIGAVSEAQSSCVRRLYCIDPGETSSENEELDRFCFLLWGLAKLHSLRTYI